MGAKAPRKAAKTVAAGVVVLLLLAGVLVACGQSSDGDGDGGSPASGKTTSSSSVFRMGTSYTLESTNPFIATSLVAAWTLGYTYPHLVQYDTDLEIVPSFATSWTTSDDGLTRTFELVPDAKWTDGKPVTAADVAWTLNTMIKYQDSVASYYQSQVQNMDSVTAEGPSKLVIRYKAAQANALDDLFSIPVLPQHVWEQYDTNGGKGLRTFSPEQNLPAVSSGPFVLAEYTKDQSLILKRNDDYWGEKPAISVAGLQFFTSDDAAVTALKSHQIDYLVPVPASAFASLKQDGNIVTTEAAPARIIEIAINSNKKKPEHRELLDPRVKLALDHAIPRERIIELAFGGLAEPAASKIPPAVGAYHSPDLEPAEFNLDTANSMLDELGYERGPDGIRIADGHKMSYPVIAGPSTYGARMVQLMAAEFKKIGVELKLRKLPGATAREEAYGPDNKYLTSDFYIDEFGTFVDPTFLLSATTCAARGGQNNTGYCDPEYDKMFEEQATTLDPDKRLALIYEMQKKIYDERPYFFMAYTSSLEAHYKTWADDTFVPIMGSSLNDYSTKFLTVVHD